MAIAHAINIKNYTMKSMIESRGVLQVAIVCPPPIYNRYGYENTIQDVFTKLSEEEIKCIVKPTKTRAKRSKNKTTATATPAKKAKAVVRKVPSSFSVYSTDSSEGHFPIFGRPQCEYETDDSFDVFDHDASYDDASPTDIADLFNDECERGSIFDTNAEVQRCYGYWTMESDIYANKTVNLGDIDIFYHGDLNMLS